jgi:hypothetical protein
LVIALQFAVASCKTANIAVPERHSISVFFHFPVFKFQLSCWKTAEYKKTGQPESACSFTKHEAL